MKTLFFVALIGLTVLESLNCRRKALIEPNPIFSKLWSATALIWLGLTLMLGACLL